MTETDATTTTELSARVSPKRTANKRTQAKRRKSQSSSSGSAKLKTSRTSGTRIAGKKPTTIEEARLELLRVVCSESREITHQIVVRAKEGNHLCAKFLFEAVGLCDIKADEMEEGGDRESFARLLLKQWQLPQPNADCEVTIVPEQVPAVLAVEEAPVKS